MTPPENWPRNYLIIAVLAMASWIGYSIWQAHHHPAAIQQHLDQANLHEGKREVLEQKGAQADAAEQKDAGRVADLDARVQSLTRQLAQARRLAGSSPQQPPVGGGGVDSDHGVEHAVLGSPGLDATKDALIEAQAKEIGALKTQVVDLTTARDSYRAGLEEEKQVSKNLRAALNLSEQLRHRPRALGASYDPADRSWGAQGSYDFGRLRLGVEVIQQPAGSQRGYSARLSAAFNF